MPLVTKDPGGSFPPPCRTGHKRTGRQAQVRWRCRQAQVRWRYHLPDADLAFRQAAPTWPRLIRIESLIALVLFNCGPFMALHVAGITSVLILGVNHLELFILWTKFLAFSRIVLARQDVYWPCFFQNSLIFHCGEFFFSTKFSVFSDFPL